MKKTLLSVLTLGLGFSAMAQGIAETAAYDDFMKASEFSDEYSIEVPAFETFPCPAEQDTAYMGIYKFDNKDDVNFKMDVNRNMDAGELELKITQGKGGYEPFGFIFGSYCDGGNEGKFGLDLSDSAVLELVIRVDSIDQKDDLVDGNPTGDAGIQIKIQAEDGNGKSIAFDQDYDPSSPDDFWQYEIGVTGDGSKPSNDFLNGSNSITQGNEVTISYDLKRGVVAGSDDKPDVNASFDYSNVVAIKITFASNNKDQDSGYDPYEHYGEYAITSFKIGDLAAAGIDEPEGLGDGAEKLSASIFPNPASSVVTFSETLEEVAIYNAQGVEVFTADKAKTVNVSTFETGMYIVKSSKGAASFMVK